MKQFGLVDTRPVPLGGDNIKSPGVGTGNMARSKVEIKDTKTNKIYPSMYAAGKELAVKLGGKKKGYDPESRLVWFGIARDHVDRFEYRDDSTKGKFKPLKDRVTAAKVKPSKKESAEDEKASAKARLKETAKKAREEEEEEEDDEEEEEPEDEEDEDEDEDEEDEEEDEEEEDEPAPAKSKKLAPSMKAGKGKPSKK